MCASYHKKFATNEREKLLGCSRTGSDDRAVESLFVYGQSIVEFLQGENSRWAMRDKESRFGSFVLSCPFVSQESYVSRVSGPRVLKGPKGSSRGSQRHSTRTQNQDIWTMSRTRDITSHLNDPRCQVRPLRVESGGNEKQGRYLLFAG